MKHIKNKRSTTIFTRVCLPLFAVMILQAAIFYFVTVYGRVVSTLNSNSTDILEERIGNRHNEIESTFSSQWVNMKFYCNALNQIYSTYQNRYDTSLCEDVNLQRRFISEASSTMFTMIRNNGVNGVFIILNNSEEYKPVSEKEQKYYGLCIRDYDPQSGYTDREDLLVERCPSSIAADMGCSLDSYWDALYSFDSVNYPGDYFYKPLKEAYDNPGVDNDNLAYFCGLHRYSESDKSVMSYSLPLISENGDIYGVIGIELTSDYLSSLLPSEELQGPNDSAYMLVQYEEDGSEYKVLASDGTLYQRCFDSSNIFKLDDADIMKEYDNIYSYSGENGIDVCMALSPISIYNRNTPFENQKVAIVGVVRKSTLFKVSSQIKATLLFVTILTLIIGFVGIFIVCHMLSRPVKKLAAKVKTMGPDEEVGLEHINIREIDQLTDAIENQSRVINQSKVRTEFFSRMSHDMRTPMNAIIGFSSQELVEGCEDRQLKEYLGKINGSGKYLLGLINEVLDMTKIDSGRMELENKPVSSENFWNGILPMISELAQQKNINFVHNIDSDGSYTMAADEQRLSQVYVNLLSNAMKFTPQNGTVSLNITEKKCENNNLLCKVIVHDTGIGMSKEFLEKLYQPFVQEHPNREGTGLGLSIAHQLVSIMGGTITCESEVGLGTTFTVELKFPIVNEVVNESGTISEYTQDELKNKLSGKNILLCEDHPLNRQIACKLLQKYNMNVEVAENGSIGVDIFMSSKKFHFDAVLMDIRMPVMNGLEAAKAIRALDREDAGKIPIIAMTANAFKEDMDASAAAGMNRHLSKPIEPNKLYQTLAELIID